MRPRFVFAGLAASMFVFAGFAPGCEPSPTSGASGDLPGDNATFGPDATTVVDAAMADAAEASVVDAPSDNAAPDAAPDAT